jgi:eukaryotic-like serine/threonine-protein kinase
LRDIIRLERHTLASQREQRRLRFGPFDADAATGELRRDGRAVRLQEQPFQVLIALLERPGEVVTREELRARLWPADTFGEFDQGLNTAINKLREALGDSAASPRFIETLPKRGYRFVHPIEPDAEPAVANVSAPPESEPKRSRTYIAIPLALVACILAVVWAWRPLPDQSLPFRHFTLRFNAPTNDAPHGLIAVSPNGHHIAIVDRGKTTIWVQDLEHPQARMIEGTEHTGTVFWSPDSLVIGFVAETRKLKKVAVKGGPVTLLYEGPEYISGASWNPDGRSIVFASGTPSSLYVVSANGGSPVILISAEKSTGKAEQRAGLANNTSWLSNPHFLQTARGFTKLLYENKTRRTLVLRDMESGVEHVLGEGTNGTYSPDRHLVYRSGSDLWARPLSPEKAKLEGEPFLVARLATDPSVASDGTLVYRDVVTSQLVWRNRLGTRLGTVGNPVDVVAYPCLSPDGRRVAVETLENENLDIWAIDVERGARVRLSSHPSTEVVPVWSPEGDQVAFGSYRAGNIDILSRPSDAGGDELTIAAGTLNERISDWSRDGQYILYSIYPKNGSDLAYLQRAEGGRWESHPLLETPAYETSAKFSPDGRYVAYLSDESGQNELYVREFVPGGRKWPVSTNGASQIRWGRNGRELFYSEAGTLMAVPVSFVGGFSAGQPSRLFSHPAFSTTTDANYDVSPDGQRIVLPERVGEQERVIHVVQNWLAGFRKNL